MKKVFIAVLVASLAVPALAKSGYTRGYVKRDGTYVSPSYRTSPNGTKLDNYSTKGNYNPYSGRAGTVDPYKPTQSNPYGSPYNSGRNYNSGYGE